MKVWLHSILQRWLAGLAIILVICRQYYPSLDADTGSGVIFAAALAGIGGLALVYFLLMDRRLLPAVPLFLFPILLSTFVAEYRFPAVMMAGEWLGLAGLWLAIQLVGPAMTRQVVAPAILFVALGQAFLGFHQVYFETPAMLKRWDQGDQQFLRDLEILGLSNQIALRARLEANLPFGTQGHTNSLAALLVLALPILASIFRSAWRNRASSTGKIAGVLCGLAILAIGWALVLTQCRSAWLAGLLVLSLQLGTWHYLARVLGGARNLIIIVSLLVTLVVGYASWTHRFGGAFQSLGYRVEYWRGSWPVIARHPILGVGFGNFRDHYLAHKLAQSSEEIADPHNFIVELAACSGILSAIAYLFWLGQILYRFTENPESLRSGSITDGEAPVGRVLAAIVVTCLVVGYATGLDLTTFGFLSAGFCLGALLSILARSAELSASGRDYSWYADPILLALLGVHLHFLVAGGIGHPGTMAWVILLAGCSPARAIPSKIGSWGNLAAVFALGLLAIFSGFYPLIPKVIERDLMAGQIRSLESSGIGRQESGQRDAGKQEALTRVLPADVDVWLALARYYQHRLEMEPPGQGQRYYDGAESAYEHARKLRPRNFGIAREWSQMELAAAQRFAAPTKIDHAIALQQHAAQLYPNSPDLLWDLAFCNACKARTMEVGVAELKEMLTARREIKITRPAPNWGRDLVESWRPAKNPAAWQAAQLAAQRALELDQATPHLDKKLTVAQRAWATSMVTAFKVNSSQQGIKP